MTRPPLRLIVLAGPGQRPEGCRDATLSMAERRGLDLIWRDLADEDSIVEALGLANTSRDEHEVAVVLASGDLADSGALANRVRHVRSAGLRVIHAAPEDLEVSRAVPAACDGAVHGRHRRSFHGAVDRLVTDHEHPPTTLPYGDDPEQVADLRVPPGTGSSDRRPIAVLLHGGFWLHAHERDLMAPLAVALTHHGWATWNVEYRRRGPTGGGWPTTLEDACAALDAVIDLPSHHPVDTTRVVLIGHSAGAQLAWYAARRAAAPSEAPGTIPRVAARGLVSLAGVLDLHAAADDDLGDGAVTAMFGQPQEHPDRYHLASAGGYPPLHVPQLVMHGPDDRLVPVTQSTRYVEAAREAGDDVAQTLPSASHLDLVAPAGAMWTTLTAWLERFDPPAS